MNAKEMFEKLGYKQEYHISYIKYYKEVEQCCGDPVEIQIWFYQIDECFEKNREVITMEELQAINKQIEELGWNDTIININVKLDGKKVMEAMRGGINENFMFFKRNNIQYFNISNSKWSRLSTNIQ